VLDRLFEMIGYGLCHQLPDRSFFAGGYQLPVCARDTGIYLGFALGLIALWILARGTRPSELPRWPVLVVIGLFVAAMGVDGVTSYSGMRATTNEIRLITGIITGWAMSTLTFPMINSQIWIAPGQGRVPDGRWQVLRWLAMLAVAYGVARWVMPLTGVLYPLVLSLSILVTFSAINLVFVGLMPVFERRARRARDAWLPALIAIVMTLIELAGAGWLRTFAESLI